MSAFPAPSTVVDFVRNTWIPNLDDLGALTDTTTDNPVYRDVLAWLAQAKRAEAALTADDWETARADVLKAMETWLPARPSQSQWQDYRNRVVCNAGWLLAMIGDK